MTFLRRLLSCLFAWGPCGLCGERHDPSSHYGLHDDLYDQE